MIKISRTYSVDEMLKLIVGLNGEFVHVGTDKPYYIYELAEIYHQEKLDNAKEYATNTKNKPFVALEGHRKQMFSETQKQDIRNIFHDENISKRELARQFKCSEATIRRILK